jgi:hypothetical protein
VSSVRSTLHSGQEWDLNFSWKERVSPQLRVSKQEVLEWEREPSPYGWQRGEALSSSAAKLGAQQAAGSA